MRPIKFRAWLPEKQLMLNVHCIYFDNETGDVESVVLTTQRMVTRDEQSEVYTETYGRYPIAQVELMQGTGEVDTKGQEIFVGDILTSDYDVPRQLVVPSQSNILCVEDKTDNPKRLICNTNLYYTIAGNIHQQPALVSE